MSDEAIQRLLLDANILLRSKDRASLHYPVVHAALDQLSASGVQVCLCAQNLIEFWSVATRPVSANGMGIVPATARQYVEEFTSTFPMLAEPADLAARWLEIVDRYGVISKQAHDARLVALMTAHQVDYLLTFNAGDFARYAEITALDPGRPDSFPSP
jgi:predicted nucleic acid-binding protein